MARFYEAPMGAAVLAAAMTVACSGDEAKKPASAAPAAAAATPAPLGTSGAAASTPLPPVDIRPKSFADGEAAYAGGNYAEATEVFAAYVGERPKNAWGHYMLGLSAWKAGERERSEAAFQEALRLDPRHVKSLVNLSRVLIEQGRSDEAVMHLTTAAELDPNAATVHRLLGRAYHAQGRIDESIAEYRRAIELDPKDSWSMNNLGLVFIEQGRASEALPVLARAVTLGKQVAVFHNNFGMALEHTGRFSAAAESYRAALAADAGYEKATRNLARVELVKESPQEPLNLEALVGDVSEPEPQTAGGAVPNAAASSR